MQLHELKPTASRKDAKRIGRGGKRGKTSGRGGKGQTARAGSSMRPEMRDVIKKLPKLRGFGKNRARTVNSGKKVAVAVNVSALEAAFDNGATVNPKALVAAKVVSSKNKTTPRIKILGGGELSKKLTIAGCEVSQSAKAKIEKAGGSIS
jgi:large subunit ribosomal protein L15